MKIVVVNLERSVDRRRSMEELLAREGVKGAFFPAIDGRGADHPLFARVDQRLAEMRRGFQLNRGEIGCFASHYLLWEQAVSENEPVLILEDDIAVVPGFAEAVDLVERHVEARGLIRLSAHKDRPFAFVEALSETYNLVRFPLGPHGTTGYAVSPAAANKLLKAANVWFEPVDCHLDRFWTHGVSCFAIHPFPVVHACPESDNSEIRSGLGRAKKSRRYRRIRSFYRHRDNVLRRIANWRYKWHV